MTTRHPFSSRHRANPSLALVVFVTLYMLACSALALRQGNTEFLMYAVVMVIFIFTALTLHHRVHFTPTALWLLAIWGFLHMLGGTLPINPELTDTFRAATSPEDKPASAVLYSLRYFPNLPRYDQLIHTFGFFSATVASFEAAKMLLSARRSVPLAVVAALMGVGLGALNEVVEFFAVLTIPDTNVGGYTNTGWDLVSNTIGATIGAIYSLTRRV
jgi:uncharacterized membrane protein YjdF